MNLALATSFWYFVLLSGPSNACLSFFSMSVSLLVLLGFLLGTAATFLFAVFASFTPNTMGTMAVRVNAPSQIYSDGLSAVIPEMSDTGLWIALIIGGFVAFCYFKIRSTL